MYAGCLKLGRVCMRPDPLQAAYTSITSQKKTTNKETDRARRTGMAPTGDQNPLKTQKLTETQKGNQTN
jgi:hypothetical protein